MINKLILGVSFLLMLSASVLFFKLDAEFSNFRLERLSTVWGAIFLYTASVVLLYKAIFFIYVLTRYFKYKPIESVMDGELPYLTVIVPAYNEGKQVYDTLLSLANSNYPISKLELLAVDDGSKDDTWLWMQKAKKHLGNRVSIFQQSQNKGKRHALYKGFKIAKGEVFVTVDSDSEVDSDTLRNLVSPFIIDKNCGAVAGNIRVLNAQQKMLPKMLDVSFALSFEFIRAAQSTLNAVLCTPGALAAYKKEAVFNCVEEWINQKFMGKPSDIGEDRAMTNMILRQGKNVLFQKNANAYTHVPETYKGLYKMFIRWGRSNVRETIAMARYVFTDFRKASKIGPRLLFLSQAMTLLLSYPFTLFMFYFILSHPLLFLSSTLFGIFIFSSFPALFYAKHYDWSKSFWAFSYSILYTFALFWITPYAIATASRSGWLTRG